MQLQNAPPFVDIRKLGHTGKIITSFQKAGYEITDLQLFRLEKADAEEFLEVYKGVVPEYYVSSSFTFKNGDTFFINR